MLDKQFGKMEFGEKLKNQQILSDYERKNSCEN